MVFIYQIKNTLGALSLKNIKNEHSFLLFFETQLGSLWLGKQMIIDSRCLMTLSSLLLQSIFAWVMLNPSGNSIPVGWQQLVLPWYIPICLGFSLKYSRLRIRKSTNDLFGLSFPTRRNTLITFKMDSVVRATYIRKRGLVKVDNQVIWYLMPLFHLFNLSLKM